MVGRPTFCLGCNSLKNYYCSLPKTILLENLVDNRVWIFVSGPFVSFQIIEYLQVEKDIFPFRV